jgi:hypothetical protein
MYELTAAGVSVVALAIALGLMHKKVLKKAVPWTMIVAGAGIAGALGSLIQRAVGAVLEAFTAVGAALLGAGAGLAFVVWIVICVLPHLKPKGQPPTRMTPWLAFVLPALLVATGGFMADIVVTGQTTLGDVGTAMLATLGEAWRSATA